MKYTIESMVYCSQLPNMVRALWLWRICWDPIRKGEIFCMNNNWACYLLLYKAFYFFPLVLANNLFHLICLCKQFFQDFFKPPIQKVDGPSLSWTLARRLNWNRASAVPNWIWHCGGTKYEPNVSYKNIHELTLTSVNRYCTVVFLWTFKLRTVGLKWNKGFSQRVYLISYILV